MKKPERLVKSIIKKTVTHMVDTELYEWPPKCAAFLYQPTRPQRKDNVQLDIARRTDRLMGKMYE